MLSAQLIKNYPTFYFIQRERDLYFFSIGIFLLSFKDEKLELEYQAGAVGMRLDLEHKKQLAQRRILFYCAG